MNLHRPILLVEDSPMDVDLTRRAFGARNVLNPFVIARDGEEAIDYIDRWQEADLLPIVILLDIKLPRASGLEVLQHLKSHARFRVVPVVVLTTSKEGSDIEQAYQLGANSYIVKPVEFDKFLDVARQIDLYWAMLNRAPD